MVAVYKQKISTLTRLIIKEFYTGTFVQKLVFRFSNPGLLINMTKLIDDIMKIYKSHLNFNLY